MSKIRVKSISKSGKEFDKQEMERQAKALAENFQLIGIQLTNEIEIGMNKAGILVAGRAKKLAPVDTGLLRGSMVNRVVKDGGEVVGEVGTNTEYAPFQEFGTSKMQAANEGRGFLNPALNNSKGDINSILKKALKDSL